LHRSAPPVGEMSAPPLLRHNQQHVPSQSVQAPNANSFICGCHVQSSHNDMSAVTELNGAESEEDRIMSITKIVLKLMKQNGRLSS
jgi:hypothetical protein